MRKPVYLLLVFLFIAKGVVAQIHNFQIYGIDEGLSQSQVTSICQDQTGYIWLATKGGGLNRFDGKNFVSYTMQDGLSSNTIRKVFCDSKGELWIGTNRGISHYNGKKFKAVPTPFEILDKDIWDITEDKKGNIWFATGGYGVIRFDGANFSKFGINDGLGFSHAISLYCDKNGNIWVGSNAYGLACNQGEFFENISRKSGLNAEHVSGFCENFGGDLLAFTNQGVFAFDGLKFNPHSFSFPVETGNRVSSSLSDSKKNVWIATEHNGIYRIKKNEMMHFAEENGLPGTTPLCIFEDKQGNIWFGFDGSGCAVFSNDRFIHYNKQSGLPNNNVKSVLQDRTGNFWIGTEEGLSYYNFSTFTNYGKEQGISDPDILALYEDQQDNIWIGTNDGVVKYTSGTFTPYNISTFGKIGPVYCFFEHPVNKELLIGTDEGVMSFNGNGFNQRFLDSLPDLKVYAIRSFAQNEIFYCTDKGAFRFNGNSFSHLPLRDEYGKVDVFDCWKDPLGNIWFISGRGIVVKRKNESYQNIKKRHGLSSDNLQFMLYDGTFLWIGSDRGLDRISPDEDWQIDNIKRYGRAEGLNALECNPRAVLLDHKKRIWIGTIKGVSRYDPEQDVVNTVPPVLKITGMRLQYQHVNWADLYPEDTIQNNIPRNITLRNSDNHLTFDFIAFDYSNPKKIRYQYFLEGFDKNWSPDHTENSITYSNIPPGNYRFGVRAANGSENWCEPVYIEFKIDAPFWKKRWFYALLLPFIIIIFYSLLLLRTRKLNKTKRVLEEKVRLRTSELNQQKEELEKLSIVASSMNEGVVICGPSGEIEWINESFYRMAGFSPEEFRQSVYGKAKSIQEISSYPQIETVVKEFRKKKEPLIYDSSHFDPSGKVIWTRGSIVPVYDKNGELVRIIAIYTDITDRKLVELVLEQANKDFVDSVKYAKRIQEAILPNISVMEKEFPESFVFYRPKDIVSGDFYWFNKFNDVFLWAVADCTGHGVPGAFMSIIGNEFLHQIANNTFVTGPEQCLHFLDKQVTRALHQEGEDRESRDGMDIGLCSIHPETRLCQFSGANIPLYLVRDGQVIVQEAVKESIGGFNSRGKEFYSHEFPLLPGDVLYMTTDGYIDQFGGPIGKKFMRKRFQEMIAKIHPLPMKEQMLIIEEEFNKWKSDMKQLDDVLVVALRIP